MLKPLINTSILLLSLLFCNIASAAGNENEAARIALQNKAYEEVVKITTTISKQEPSSGINWYRMSIAAARLNQFTLAEDSLKKAVASDPKLKFATSAAKVKNLQNIIDKGLNPLLINDSQSAKLSSPIEDSIDSNSAQNFESEFSKVNLKLEEIKRESSVSKNYIIYGATGFGLLILFLTNYYLLHAYRYKHNVKYSRHLNNKDLSRMPLDDLISLSCDNNSILIERLKLDGHGESALYQALTRSLPALELETGRAKVDVNNLISGFKPIGLNRVIKNRSFVLGVDDPKLIHSRTIKSLLDT